MTSHGSWFQHIFGEEERCSASVPTAEAYDATQALFKMEGDVLLAPNGRRFRPGRFETPSLAELCKQGNANSASGTEPLVVENVVGDVRDFIVRPEAEAAVFQVASQFNCLEFVDRGVTPEFGVRGYEFDKTQGPAAALSCAASAVWRNYFMHVDVAGACGQRAHCQLNCLQGIVDMLGSDLLEVRNGYSSSPSVEALDQKVAAMNDEERDHLRGLLQVGVQWSCEVTRARVEHVKNSTTGKWESIERLGGSITQVFCSAVALGSSPNLRLWKGLASLVLEAAYEATLAIAATNVLQGGSRDVYFTLLGGGAFGNGPKWIEAAIHRALQLYKMSGLRVKIVHYSERTPWMPHYRSLVNIINNAEHCDAVDIEDTSD